MKNTKNSFIGIIMIVIMVSCQKETIDEITIDTARETTVSKDIVEKIAALGVNTSAGIVPYSINGIKGWLVGDIFFSDDVIANTPALPSKNDAERAKLFRTFNLVNVPGDPNLRRFINVRGASSLPANTRTAISRALGNYNNLNLRIRFNISYGDDTSDTDIFITTQNLGGLGAVAGFPSNGNPFDNILIDPSALELGEDDLTHLITHELGHCIGLRHSDFRIREGCTDSGNEDIIDPESLIIGAVNIPGTDATGGVLNSVMRACFTEGAETGTFKGEDVTALQTLY